MPATNALQRLVLLPWRATLALNSFILIVLFFVYGYWWPYWRIADMDFWMVYEAILFNDRLPQEYFDHPAYLSILLTGLWFWLGQHLGLLASASLAALPPAADIAGFETMWTALTRSGRLLSLFLALLFINAFAFLLRSLVGDWRIAALGTLFLTFSGGLAMHARIMRTELVSASLTTISLLILLIAAQRLRGFWRPAIVGVAVFVAVLAVINKVQAVFLVAGIPVVALAFGSRIDAATDIWRGDRSAVRMAALYCAGGLALFALAAPLIWFGLRHASESIFPFRPLIGGVYGTYQVALVLWLLAVVVAFARIWRVSLLETLSVAACITGGMGLALLSLSIRYHPQVVIEVVNPIEQLYYVATWTKDEFARTDSPFSMPFLKSLLAGFVSLIARKTFILHSSSRPTIFLEWLVIFATVFAWRRGQAKLALQAGSLIALGWLFDWLGMLRNLKIEYFLYTDPFVIIAAAILVGRLPALSAHRLAYPVGVALIVAHVAISQSAPIKQSFRSKLPTDFCQPHMYYTKRVPTYPYCLHLPGAG